MGVRKVRILGPPEPFVPLLQIFFVVDPSAKCTALLLF